MTASLFVVRGFSLFIFSTGQSEDRAHANSRVMLGFALFAFVLVLWGIVRMLPEGRDGFVLVT